MNNTIRSDSYSESVKLGLHPLTTTPITANRRAATTGNVHRGSVYYPAMSDLSSSAKSIGTAARKL
jgi:hypothetical protein